jgi:hypothetical protein
MHARGAQLNRKCRSGCASGSHSLRVARELRCGPPHVAACTALASAANRLIDYGISAKNQRNGSRPRFSLAEAFTRVRHTS